MKKNGGQIWISFDVQNELESLLEDEQRLIFEEAYKKGRKDGYIVDSRHKYRLNEPFKTLAQDLRKEKVRLERTDRNLIALSLQVKAEIKTTDPGIIQAMYILRTANTKWKKYVLAIERDEVEDFSHS